MALSKLKSFDLYPKVADDVRVHTFAGALLSLLASAAIIVLFVSELLLYLHPDRVDHLEVDTTRGQHLKIHFDVSFPKLPCELVRVEAMDVAGSASAANTAAASGSDAATGDAASETRSELFTRGISPAGELDSAFVKVPIAHGQPFFGNSGANDAPADACGSCYGAETHAGECCSTCADVHARYKAKGWPAPLHAVFAQCSSHAEAARRVQEGYGCRVAGTLHVKKVAGNIHLTPAAPPAPAPASSSSLIAPAAIDVRHTIHRLEFGDHYPGQVNPLDGASKPATGGYSRTAVHSMFLYYLKVVPTLYEDAQGTGLATNQFSATEHAKALTLGADASQQKGAPGVYLFYELSPIMVTVTHRRAPVLHFVTQLCAIIGGVFTVMGMLDRFVYASVKHVEKRFELGKQH